MIEAGFGVERVGAGDRLLLLAHVGVQVDIGRGKLLVPEPESDHGDVVAGEQQPHRGRVPERVHRDVLAVERWAALGGDLEVVGQASFDRVAAEVLAGGGRKQRIGRVAGALGQPRLEHLPGLRHQRRSPLLAALAYAVNVRAG